MKFASIMGVVASRFVPNAQECEDCNKVNDLESAVCEGCGGTNLRPIESKEVAAQSADPGIRRAS